MIPHIFIKKGAVLKGVDLVGLNIVFEIDQLPDGTDNDDAMTRAIEQTVDSLKGVYITGCYRSTVEMYAESLAKLAIEKARFSAMLKGI